MGPKLREISENEKLPKSLECVRGIVQTVYEKVLIAYALDGVDLWESLPIELLSQEKKLFFHLNCCDRCLVFIHLAKQAGYCDGNLVVFELESQNGEFQYHCGVEVNIPGQKTTLVYFDPGSYNIARIGYGKIPYACDPSRKIRQEYRVSFEQITDCETVLDIIATVNSDIRSLLEAKKTKMTPTVIASYWESFLQKTPYTHLQKPKIHTPMC